MSAQFTSDVNHYGRKRIIRRLEGKSAKSAADTHELARQYYAQGNLRLAWHWAGQTAIESYYQQDFRTVTDLTEIIDAWQNAPALARQRADMLLLQTAIRTGDRSLAVERLHALSGSTCATVSLLRAQACYLMNRFDDGVALCGELAHHAGDLFLAPRALGIRAACLIAVGRQQEAADDFALAKELAAQAGDSELEMEILRLSPEVEPEPIWKIRFEEMLRSTVVDQYPYLQAKCLHNFGAFLALTSDGREGLDQIISAMAVFRSGNYPEYSYSAVLLSAIMLLSGQIFEARDLLESSEVWCHEQYDTFGLRTNLGISYALENDWTMASHFFTEAQACLDDPAFPLDDPYLDLSPITI